ncbi:MAG TPA: CehA/McbA family metallohydrolase [Acidobacteriota bacterium]
MPVPKPVPHILAVCLLFLGEQTRISPDSIAAEQTSRDGLAPARVLVEIRDQDASLVPARLYLDDGDGSTTTPPGLLAYHKGKEHHFIGPGSFEMELSPGVHTLLAERGTEYLPDSTRIDALSGRKTKVTVHLRRWISMNRHGWYSGDLHNHRPLEEVPALLLAEDLNIAPTLTDWIWEDRPRSAPPQTSESIRRVDLNHYYSVLDKEVERLEQGPGAVDLLGLRSIIPFSGYRLYPPSDVYCHLAHAQGGYVDAEKILWRDAAALVALGHIDFAGIVHNHFNRHGVELETDKWGMIPKYRPEFNTVAGMPLWSMDVYYRWLNCGFRLPVSAGSASGVKASPLGYNRVYVKVAGPLSYEKWFESLKAGRSFATNGPMLFFTVDGKELGSVLQFDGGKSQRVKIRAEAVSPRPLDRMEIIFRGRILKTMRDDARKQTAGARRQEAGSRRQEAGSRQQEAGRQQLANGENTKEAKNPARLVTEFEIDISETGGLRRAVSSGLVKRYALRIPVPFIFSSGRAPQFHPKMPGSLSTGSTVKLISTKKKPGSEIPVIEKKCWRFFRKRELYTRSCCVEKLSNEIRTGPVMARAESC